LAEAWTIETELSHLSIGRAAGILSLVVAMCPRVVAGQAPRTAREKPAPQSTGVSRASAFAARKAERLLESQLPCLGCHTLRGTGGRIGPDLTTVRERRSPDYIAAMIKDPQQVVPGSAMPRPLLDAASRDLVTTYLQGLPGNGGTAPTPGSTAAPNESSVESGARLYARWCAACHGATGRGDGPNAAYLPTRPTAHADAVVMRVRSDDALFDTIAGGGTIMNRSPRMPAFGGTLTSAEIRALVAHLRSLCRCQGPEWSRDDRTRR
jgi:mono/diheme cytochrome c family protein